MPQVTSLQITLSEDALKFVREKVSKGEFASESDVINESVAAMQDHDAADQAEFETLIHVAAPEDDQPAPQLLFVGDECHVRLVSCSFRVHRRRKSLISRSRVPFV